MKTCITCLETKSLDEFGSNKRYPDGKHRICRACHNAYQRAYKWAHGTTPVEPFLERLWNSIQICSHGTECVYCCWPWEKGTDQDGYGKFTTTNAQKRHLTHPAARIVYEIWHACRIPDGLVTCHYCDAPACCSPAHLWLGTPTQNRMDCVQKGRQAKGLTAGTVTHPEAFARGEERHHAKLTEGQVLTIRELHASGVSAYKLSFMYPVSKFAILCIVNRKTWRHI